MPVCRKTLQAGSLWLAMAWASLAGAQPIVFWLSDPVRPDDTVLVTGADFGAEPSVEIVPLPAGITGDPGTAMRWPAGKPAQRLRPVQASDESLKFTLPASWQPGAWLLRIVDQQGRASEPVSLNLPTVYWSQGDEGLSAASPGGWLRIFGRCVGDKQRTGAVRLVGDGKSAELKVTSSDVWSVSASVPGSLTPGRWRVWVHSGLGGALGWIDAGEVKVRAPEKWPAKVFNVRDFGASGNGEPTDGLGIAAAVQAASESGGGVVYFPRGRYRLDQTLEVPKHTILRGESRELSALFWPDTDDPYVLVQGSDHFGMEDLTLYASSYIHAIAGSVGEPDSGHVFLRRLRVRADMYRGHLKFEQVDDRFRAQRRLSTGGGDTVRLGGEHVEITDCDFYGAGRSLYLLRVRGALVQNNTFYNGRWGWYCLDGSDGLILEHNRILGADLMSTGGSLNCYTSGYSQNVYYARNELRLMHGWDREAMTTDAGYGAYYGRVEPTGNGPGSAVIRLLDKVDWRGKKSRWLGAGVFILGGRGMGQYRRIAAIDETGTAVTLDAPWAVQPDSTSVVTITMLQRRYLFIGNRFEDAGVALQYYGTSIEHVAAGNTAARAGGFYNSGRWYRHYQPSWYCQFLNNEILEGNGYRFGANNATGAGDSFIGSFGLQRGDNPAPLCYASVLRGNHLHNNAQIRLLGVSAEHPGLRDAVVEHNIVENVDVGLFVDQGCTGVLERDNQFRGVRHPRYDAAALRREQQAARAKYANQQRPVFHLTFDQRLGRVWADASSSNFPAMTVRGQVAQEPSFAGQCGRFDGASHLLVADRGVLRFPSMTLSAWVWPDKMRGRWGVIARRASNQTSPYVFTIRDGRVGFEATDDQGQWSYNCLSQPCLKPDQWNHIAAVVVEGKEVRLYCNGRRVGGKSVKRPLTASEQPLTIGFEAWGGDPPKPDTPGHFHGLIDEVAIWSRALSEEEMRVVSEQLAPAAARDAERRRKQAEKRAATAKQSAGGVQHAEGVAWRLVTSQTFDGAQLPALWKVLRGRWRVVDGVVACRETSYLVYAKPVRAPVRIEFDARSAHPGDLTAFFGTMRDAYLGGYFFGFASNGNTANKLLRLGEQVATSTKPLAVPGKWHHVIAQVIGDRLQLIVDGRVALDYRDRKPVVKADTAGILAWSEGEFDNVRVFTASPSK